MSDRTGKIIDLFKEAQKRGKPIKPIAQRIDGNENTQVAGNLMNGDIPQSHGSRRSVKNVSQTIKGDRNVQVAGDMINVISQSSPKIKMLPPENSIGADSLLKVAIQERFNKIGEARETRFGKQAYSVMYNHFKKTFGIKNNDWTIIWTWPRECAQEIIDYLDDLYNNTIPGRTERARKKKGALPSHGQLYAQEKKLLDHLGYDLSGPDVKQALFQYFGVTSHTELSHEQHWLWVKYLEGLVRKSVEGS